jgi:hypothetical protein
MKRLVWLSVLIGLVGWVCAGRSLGAQQTWTGSISENRCGGDHGGEVDERECTLRCVKTGDKFVLVTDYGKKVWPIVNQDFASLPEHAGHTVKVSGELKGNAIVVSKIEMP